MTAKRTNRAPFITSRGDVPEGKRHRFDQISESRGGVRGPFAVLMNSPELAGKIGEVGAYIRFDSQLQGPERELAVLSTAREFDCAYEWAIHEPIAREEGVREKAIDVVESFREVDDLSAVEGVIIQYCREVFRCNSVVENTFNAAKDNFGVQGVIELTATMGYYAMLASILNAFEVRPDSSAPELL